MAHTEHLADFPTCHNVSHAILNVQVVYCSHDMGYTMSCTLGDETDLRWSDRVWRYGPFDDAKDIANDLASYLRIMFRRRLLDGALLAHAEDRVNWYLGQEHPYLTGP